MRHDIDALRDIAREVGAHVKLPMNRENVPHVRGHDGREVCKHRSSPGFDLYADGKPAAYGVTRERAVEFLRGDA